MRHSGWIAAFALVACAHQVSQDKATGPDGRQKGAKPLVLDNGEARERDIVTYPGGDRVDWKAIELPQGQRGRLDLQLQWRTPRPGLQVAFDVFDQWNTPIGTTKSGRRKSGRIRSVSIPDARGTYFVRVYAPSRGDAGQYTLRASFEPVTEAPPVDPRSFPDPPPLVAVPEVEPECDVFDPRIKKCEKVCPEYGAPPGWKACVERDKQKAAEEAATAAELARAECKKNAPKPAIAVIKHVEVAGSVSKIKLAVGTASQPALDAQWTGEVLIGQTDRALIGGTVRIIGVDKQFTRAQVYLETDQLAANPRVRLIPPPAACP